MKLKLRLLAYVLAASAVLVPSTCAQQATNAVQNPGPQINIDAYTYTQQSLFQRNIGVIGTVRARPDVNAPSPH